MQECVFENYISYFSTKINVVGTQKNSHNEMVLLSTQGVENNHNFMLLGRVAQTVTCLTTDVSLTADPGVPSSIPAQSHTLVEIDY